MNVNFNLLQGLGR